MILSNVAAFKQGRAFCAHEERPVTKNDFETPIMPTGSGVADLEIAREQDALRDEQILQPEQAPMDDAAGGPQAESEAHPS